MLLAEFSNFLRVATVYGLRKSYISSGLVKYKNNRSLTQTWMGHVQAWDGRMAADEKR